MKVSMWTIPALVQLRSELDKIVTENKKRVQAYEEFLSQCELKIMSMLIY